MKTRSGDIVYNYWNERRGSRRAPERGDIEPGAIRGALGDSFILSCEPGYPFRLAGTRICALFGRELKGTAFHDLWAETSGTDIDDLLESLTGDVTAAAAGVSGPTCGGLITDLELLLLPLYHRGKSQARLLGVLAPLAPPVWLGGDRIARLRLVTIRYLSSEAIRFAPPFASSPASGRPRHGFVVYDGGRDRPNRILTTKS